LHVALILTLWSIFNTAMRWAQALWFGRGIRAVDVEDPVFILGYWRSGTTLLHEMLALDPRFHAPTTFQAVVPNHFVISEDFARRKLRFFLPRTRPMDNMPMAWEKPQEDELALCNLGAGSPWWSVAFPNQPQQYPRYLTLETLSDNEFARWRDTWTRYLQALLFEHEGRLLLKSPQHSNRVRRIRQIFPASPYIRIVRDPYDVFASAMRFWPAMYFRYGLQRPTLEGLEDFVLDSFAEMDRNLTTALAEVPAQQQYLLRYEDLVADPIAELRRVYAHFNWGDMAAAEARWRAYREDTRDYRTNEHHLTPEQVEKIDTHWSDYIERYGYRREVAYETG
jgi:hypothetical protein